MLSIAEIEGAVEVRLFDGSWVGKSAISAGAGSSCPCNLDYCIVAIRVVTAVSYQLLPTFHHYCC